MTAKLVTGLGDSALLIPAFLGLAAYLAIHGERRLAIGLCAALAACGAILLVGKTAFHACHLIEGALEVRSPSGHAAMSATFYGSLALIAGRGRPTWQRSAMLAGAMGLAFAIGISRIVLRAHTPSEVVIGWAVGALCVVGMRWVVGGGGSRLRLHAFAYGAVLCAILLNGQKLSPEPALRRAGLWISAQGLSCPWPGSPKAVLASGRMVGTVPGFR